MGCRTARIVGGFSRACIPALALAGALPTGSWSVPGSVRLSRPSDGLAASRGHPSLPASSACAWSAQPHAARDSTSWLRRVGCRAYGDIGRAGGGPCSSATQEPRVVPHPSVPLPSACLLGPGRGVRTGPVCVPPRREESPILTRKVVIQHGADRGSDLKGIPADPRRPADWPVRNQPLLLTRFPSAPL
jgi:hypothetical protein